MSDASARAAVLALRAQGLSNAQIGARIERSARFVSQIGNGERGPGYGKSAAPALEALARGEQNVTLARRETAEGTPAKVRKSGKAYLDVKQTKSGKIVPDTEGNVMLETKRGYKTLQSELERAGDHNRLVNVTVSAKRIVGDTDSRVGNTVELFRHGGYDANALMNRLEDYGYEHDPRGAIIKLAEARGIEIHGLQDVTITTHDRRRAY